MENNNILREKEVILVNDNRSQFINTFWELVELPKTQGRKKIRTSCLNDLL